MTLIPLGGSMAPSQTAIVAPSPRAKGAKPEEIYRAWLEIAEQRISACMTSDDYREGRAAFLEKRKPSFQGR